MTTIRTAIDISFEQARALTTTSREDTAIDPRLSALMLIIAAVNGVQMDGMSSPVSNGAKPKFADDAAALDILNLVFGNAMAYFEEAAKEEMTISKSKENFTMPFTTARWIQTLQAVKNDLNATVDKPQLQDYKRSFTTYGLFANAPGGLF